MRKSLVSAVSPSKNCISEINRLWGNSNRRMDFTTIDDTAAYTAYVALDSSSPRFLRIAGDQISPQEIKEVVSEVTGEKFRLFRAGGRRTKVVT